jgi:hypothetical protein
MKNTDSHTKCHGIPELVTLKEAIKAFNTSGITERSLRREILCGRLRALRSRPGSNAKLLIRKDELLRWLNEEAAMRQYVRKEVRHVG